MSYQNYLFLEYRRTLRKFRKLQTRFEKRIANKSFQALTARKRYQILSKLRKLKQKIEQLNSRMKLAAAGGSLAFSLGLTTAVQTEGLASSGPTGIGIPTKLTTDKTLLNSDTDGDQKNPDAAMNDLGESVFVWESADNQIVGKGFGVGDEGLEFTVTADTNRNSDPSVSINDEGDFVVAWTSMEPTTPYSTFSIKYMRYELDGENIIADGPYTLKEGSNTTYESVDSPDVALDENGNFAIVWESYDSDDPADYVKARYVDNENTSDLEIIVSDSYYNDYTNYKSAGSPAVDIASDGNFIIVWEGSYYYYEYPEMEQNYSIYSKRYHENEELESDQTVKEFSSDRLNDPDVALNEDGSYAIVWHDEYDDFSQEYIYVKKFNSEGDELCEITVENDTFVDLFEPAIDADKDGAFTVVYDLERSGGYSEILGKRYNQLAGHHEDLVFQDSGGEERAGNAAIGMNSKGDFVVVWDDAEHSFDCEEDKDCEGTGVYFKQYNNSPNQPYSINDENQVNTYSTGAQNSASVDTDANGNYVVVWEAQWKVAEEDGKGIIGQLYHANGSKNGPEFQVNTITDYDQIHPSVAMNPDGDFLVVWSSYDSYDYTAYDIKGQRFNADASKNGTEFEIDQTDEYYESLLKPSVDMNADGDAVVVWEGNNSIYNTYSIYGRILLDDGEFGGSQFRVDASTASNNRTRPDVGIDNLGNFVVVWQGDDAIGNSQSYYRRFDGNSNPLDANDVAVSTGSYFERYQSVSMDRESGEFLVAYSEDNSFAKILASKYDGDGGVIFEDMELAPRGYTFPNPKVDGNAKGEFVVVWDDYEDSDKGIVFSYIDANDNLLYTWDDIDNGATSESHTGPTIALDDQGNATVVYEHNSGGYNVYSKTVGRPLEIDIDASNEFVVNGIYTNNQDDPDIAQNADGDFVVVWTDHYNGSASAFNIKAQRYNKEGIRVGQEMTVNDGGLPVDDPALALNDSGNFMVVWTSDGGDIGGELDDIVGKVFDWDGNVIKSDFIINEEKSNNQRRPDIAINPEGNFQVIWTSRNSIGDTWDRVYGQELSPVGVADASGNQNLFEINESSNVTIHASIAINNDGDIAIPYVYQYDGTNNGLYIFDASFDPLVSNLAFSESSYVDAYPPGIAPSLDGDFIVAWSEYDLGEEAYYLMTRKYSSGSSFEADAEIVGELESEISPNIASVDDGDFMISYTQYDVDADLYSVYSRRISSELDPIGPEMKINDISASGSVNNSLASSPDGSYTIAWQSEYADGDGETVMAKQFISHKPIIDVYGLTLDEGEEMTLTAEHFNIQNLGGDQDAIVLAIKSLPAEGTLSLSGGEISVGQSIIGADLLAMSYAHDGNESTSDLFTFSVANERFETSVQTLNIIVNPVNDLPILANAIPDQNTTGFKAFSYTVPANTFSDIETSNLTLSASLADDSALPSWLNFTPSTGNFSGMVENDPDFDRTINIKVSASDGEASISDEFKINIASVLSVEENNPNGALLYPNPASGQVHLNLPSEMSGTIEMYLFNASGQLMEQTRIEKNRTAMVIDLDVAQLKRGLYLLKLVNENTTATFKFNKK
ncbi:putative Ig domain-containing protein [Reichenbachiella sp.]|uniref:putative Ig domain-containing protein n=1 Tax=Reichenbachiella sp. TaxID=2184521 RepID=UPI003B5B9E27